MWNMKERRIEGDRAVDRAKRSEACVSLSQCLGDQDDDFPPWVT